MKTESQLASYVLVGISAALICGCGPKRPETVAVHGKVTFDGVLPPGPGIVYFQPLGDGSEKPLRPAMGEFGPDGCFQVSSFSKGDGLVPGEYSVRIVCWKRPPRGMFDPEADAVPPGFKPENLRIEPGTRNVIEKHYNVPKSAKRKTN